MTCAGGVAALDMVVELIERDHGPGLASAVGDWFIRTHVRSGTDAQRPTLRERYGIANDKVLGALGRMEQRIEEPLGRAELAAQAGVSIRQLERLFSRHLGAGVGQAYLRIRLDQAQRLLRQTSMSVVEIAVACGFGGSSQFSRAYRLRFSQAPGSDRKERNPRPTPMREPSDAKTAAIVAKPVDA
jgi:transcriptional regulator GlxA family with amidase domain